MCVQLSANKSCVYYCISEESDMKGDGKFSANLSNNHYKSGFYF